MRESASQATRLNGRGGKKHLRSRRDRAEIDFRFPVVFDAPANFWDASGVGENRGGARRGD
jgi:hypothetical protein